MQHFQIVFEQERFAVRRYTRQVKESKAHRKTRTEREREWQRERIQKRTPFTLP